MTTTATATIHDVRRVNVADCDLFVPFERWVTEHGDVRTSYWGMGYRSVGTAFRAIDAYKASQPMPDGVMLSDAVVQRLANQS